MNETVRGQKHVCHNCGTKFFDFNKEIVICPSCKTELKKHKIISNIPDISKKKSSTDTDKDIVLEEEVEFDDDIDQILGDDVETENE